jgi:hypothetical protein
MRMADHPAKRTLLKNTMASIEEILEIVIRSDKDRSDFRGLGGSGTGQRETGALSDNASIQKLVSDVGRPKNWPSGRGRIAKRLGRPVLHCTTHAASSSGAALSVEVIGG